MPANYPNSLAVLTNPNATDYLNVPSHSDIETQQNLEIVALQTELGLGLRGSLTNLAQRLNVSINSNGTLKAEGYTLESLSDVTTLSVLTNKDLLMWDSGDAIWRNSSISDIADSRYSLLSGALSQFTNHSHTTLDDIGNNTHAQIDTYITTTAPTTFLKLDQTVVQITVGTFIFSAIGVNTNAPSKQVEINSVDGNNLRLTYNDSDGSPTKYADFLTNFSGDLLISSTSGKIDFNNENLITTGTLGAGAITGTSLIKNGGTSSQFLKADGSVDSSTYLKTLTLDQLTDVMVSSGLVDGQILSWDAGDAIWRNSLILRSITKCWDFTVINPNASYAIDTKVFLPITIAALKITKVLASCDANPATQIAGDLKYADAFIGLGNPALITAFDTTAGVFDSGAISVSVASGKRLYLSFDSAPVATIKQIQYHIEYKFD